MNNNFLLNLILLLIPFALYFDHRGHIFRNWKAMVPGVIITGIAAIVIKLAFTHYGLVIYEESHGSGLLFYEIPLESALFSFTVPFAGLGIYAYLNGRYPGNELEKYSLAFSNILLGLSIAILFFAYTKIYAVLTFSILLLFLFCIEYVNKLRFMYRFYRAYLAFTVLYAVSQLFFNGYNTVLYNIATTLKFKVIASPFENYFLLMLLLLVAVYLFEYFKRKNHGIA
ncbi:lycopene cyclase domain-containing protein [Pedobacter sp.]|uniref:lycopene cyclase domain-containing protein n=1 Tax=Pedobacter sp. TaxID=1411316 RepID=UPI003D7FCA27